MALFPKMKGHLRSNFRAVSIRQVANTPGPATCVQKGGHMIVLQNQKRPLSTHFFIDKITPFFSLNMKGSLFLHDADFCSLLVWTLFSILNIILWRKLTPFPKTRIIMLKMYPYFQNRGHAIFMKIDPFSVKFRTMMRTLCMLEWRDWANTSRMAGMWAVKLKQP